MAGLTSVDSLSASLYLIGGQTIDWFMTAYIFFGFALYLAFSLASHELHAGDIFSWLYLERLFALLHQVWHGECVGRMSVEPLLLGLLLFW